MTKETLNVAYSEINNFRDKLGEVFYDAFMEEDNNTYEMAKGIINVFAECELEVEFKTANRMLIAVCGYGFKTLVEKIKKRDTEGHVWLSC